jgi:hypothetical protein
MSIPIQILAVVTLVWTAPDAREDGSVLVDHEITGYTIFKNNKAIESTSGTSTSVRTPKKNCDAYTVQAIDTDDSSSKHSNTVKICKRKGKPPKNR